VRFRRKLLVRVRAAALVLFLFTLGSARLLADDISWGSTVSGMRVGVALGQGSAGKELRVVFANMAPTQRSLLIAQQGGRAPSTAYAFAIHALGGPDGKEYVIFYWVDGGLGRLVPISLVAPYVAAIPSGRMYEVDIPLKLLFKTERGGNMGLESMLRQGYKVRVSYRVVPNQVKRILYDHPDLWTGEMDSGDVGLPLNLH